ncbi:MAG: DUF1223 domain-containing protein, partial [Ktedonobacteraceae bacterium]|nr:DUF1223 domain-containing protein [Ktedonobacteraceae bacterium]
MGSRHLLAPWWIMPWAALLCGEPVTAGTPSTVAELYTSLGCSSCPPADALAGKLNADLRLLVLSFHVNYWDSVRFRDPFGSQAITDRQYAYAHSLRAHGVATPQLIVNGAQSLIGPQLADAQRVLAAASRTGLPLKVGIAKQPDGSFILSLDGVASGAEVWEVRYVKHAVTPIRGGENGGRTLETFNNVTQLRRLARFAGGTQSLQPLKIPEDGLAVIVQESGLGRVLGACSSE